MKNAYDRLLEVKKETGKNIGDLLAMSHVNDPCYFWSPKDIKLAEWFRDNVFNRYAETRGGSVYIRGLHYWYSGLEDAVKPDGTPYEHDRKSWILLKKASKAARYLGYVDAARVKDNQHPAHTSFAEIGYIEKYQPTGSTRSCKEWRYPHISSSVSDTATYAPVITPQSRWRTSEYSESIIDWDYGLPNATTAAKLGQPYHLEIWCEKSELDDVLRPICSDYGAVYVPSKGVQSITSVALLFKRIDDIKKPVRIFYISDYDHNGDGMPLGISRKIQRWIWVNELDADVKLKHLILTEEQVNNPNYTLPKKLADESKDSGAIKKWNAEKGGVVELDAFYARYPDDFKQIITDALDGYYDHDMETAYEAYYKEINSRTDDPRDEALEPFREKRRDIAGRKDAVASQYNERLEAIKNELEETLKPLVDEAEELRTEMRRAVTEIDIELPDPPEPDFSEPIDDNVLYDSTRDFHTQQEIFNAKKPKPREKSEEQKQHTRERKNKWAQKKRDEEKDESPR